MLVDLFHLERWDYLYLLQRQGKLPEHERITLYFEDNKLIRIDSDLSPHPVTNINPNEAGAVYTVPNYVDKERGLITRALEKIGLKSSGN